MASSGFSEIRKAVLALILLVVIIAVLMVFQPGLWESIKKLFSSEEIKLEGDFEPFKVEISPEEKIVDDSMKSLVCAIESVASGKIGSDDFNYEFCKDAKKLTKNYYKPDDYVIDLTKNFCCRLMKDKNFWGERVDGKNEEEAKQKCAEKNKDGIKADLIEISYCELYERRLQNVECQGVLYGDVCVECGNSITPRDNKQDAITQIGYKIIECWDKYQKNPLKEVFCGYLKKNDKLEKISYDELKEWLKQRNFKGDFYIEDKAYDPKLWYSICGLYGRKTLFGQTAIRGVNILRPGGDCKNLENLNPVNEEKNKAACNVMGFELPQKLDMDWQDWVGLYDFPQYVVYHQKFPDGADKAWQSEPLGLFYAGLGVQAVFTLIPIGGKIIGKSIGESYRILRLSRLANIASKSKNPEKYYNKMLNLIAIMGKRGDDMADVLKLLVRKGNVDGSVIEFVEKEVIKRNLNGNINLVLRNVARNPETGQFMGVGKKYLSEGKLTSEGIEALKETLSKEMTDEKLVDDIIKEVSKHSSPDEAIKAVEKKFSEAISEQAYKKTLGLSLSAGEVREILETAGTKRMLKEYAKEGTFEKPMREAVEKLGKLNEKNIKSFEKAVQEMDKFGSRLMRNDGTIEWIEILGTESDDALEGYLKLLDGDRLTDLGKEVEKFNLLMAGKNFGKGTIRGSLEMVGATGKTAPQRLGSFIKAQSRGLGCPAAFIALGFFGTAENCLKWVRTNQMPLLLLAGWLYTKAQNQKQIFMPAGKDNLVVGVPNLLPINGAIYKLEQAKDDYIAMYRSSKKGNLDTPEKFYLASPCKTDIEVRQEYCSGRLSRGDYVLSSKDKNGNKVRKPIKQVKLTENCVNCKVVHYWDEKYTLEEKKQSINPTGKDIVDSWWDKLSLKSLLKDENPYKIMRDTIVSDPEKMKKYLLLSSDNGKTEGLNKNFGLDFHFAMLDENKELLVETFGDEIIIPTFGDWRISVANEVDKFIDEIEDNYFLTREEYEKFLDEFVEYAYSADKNSEFFEFKLNSGKIIRANKKYIPAAFVNSQTFGSMFNCVKGYTTNINELKTNINELTNGNEYIGRCKNWRGTYTNCDKYEDKILIYDICKKMLFEPYEDSRSFVDYIAKWSTFHYVEVGYDAIENTEDVVIEFSDPDNEEILPPSKTNRGSAIDIYTSFDCVTLNPRGIKEKYKDWNNGVNFCYHGGVPKWIPVTENILSVASVAMGLFLAAPSGGTALIAGVALADATSIITQLYIKYKEHWPN